MDFSGKSVIITGGAMGIGKATAASFCRAGAKVVIGDLNERVGSETADELKSEGNEIRFFRCDVRSKTDVEELCNGCIKEFGSIDILVNNAGISKIAPIHELKEEDWDLCAAVNGKGTFLCTKTVVPYMIEAGKGCIINLASINSFEGKVERGAFSYSKGGILTLTKTLAAELGRYGIRVNAVAPGAVKTIEFMQHVKNGVVDLAALSSLTPLGDLLMPEDVAKAILFLASDDARFISGVTLPVDGGWLADGGKGLGRPSENGGR